MKLKCDIEGLEKYRDYIKDYYKKTYASFKRLKKKCESAEWNDEVYMGVMNELNECFRGIAAALSELTDGYNVRMLDELIPLTRKYLMCKSAFPK